MCGKTVMDLFNHCRKAGVIEASSGVGGESRLRRYNDFLSQSQRQPHRGREVPDLWLCGAIAVSIMVSEMAKGKDLEEAKEITNKQLAEILGGLPPNKLHRSNSGAEALTLAMKNYQEKSAAPSKPAPPEFQSEGLIP